MASLVGRDRELALARQLVRDLRDGQGARLLIEGEAGIGKTRLVQWVVEEARAVTVCRGAAHPFERTRPFGAIVDALDLHRRSPDPRRAEVGRRLAGECPAAQDLRSRIVEEIVDVVELACGSPRCCWSSRTCTGPTAPPS